MSAKPTTSRLTPASDMPSAGSVPPRRNRRAEHLAALMQRHGALVVLVLVCLTASFAFDTFATQANLSNLAIQAAIPSLIALGMTFVILTGGIDLSVGTVFILGGILAAIGNERAGAAGALLLPLVVCGGVGAINGLLVAKARMAPFIVTLTTLLAARGLSLAITDEGAETRRIASDSLFAGAGQNKLLGLGIPVFVALGLYALGALLLQRTRFGQSVLAVGGSEDAASLMGLPVARTKFLVYTLSGLLAGFAGALNAARLSSGVTIGGIGLELDAIAAVVIGGTLLVGGAGTVSGTLYGVGLLTVIQNIINQVGNLNSSYQAVVSGGFLIVVVVVQTVLARTQRL